ncbi:hypothetical protein PHLCEN_2v9560 [Hermanssonia centrifuga]|uniref:DUF6535 domain-containing protein n=1 Tax=Hermanssonia centrifuga TaxID=98765 RepID=A0A2R6NQJ8_9APHY|nr:hypothetical protein PHLCEN_2v9560 [Hermanssonia centrifuga]
MEHTIQNENQPVFLTANPGPESPETGRQAKGLISGFPSTGVTEKPSCGCCTGSHSKESTEEPDGWKVLLEAMEQADQKTLDRWKAEMDSLLIFAGLLSAVVTAFTVESYQWLTDDPASTSVILLAQISEKMNSFSVGHSFINTTLSNPPSPNISGFSVPSDAVMINILWILSLTFSLIAAFFSLAVQQWLRHIPLPEDMTIRQSIRLRQFRQSGLAHWRVPMIVSFLPILVQVAVILFLIGLLYLLRPLNREIGLAFTMVAGSLLASFTITAFLPFYYRDCPYKSSVFPTILYIIQPIAKCILYFVLFGVYIVATSIIFTIYLGACAMVMALWVPIATFVVLLSVVSILCLAIAVSFDYIGVCLRTIFSPITRRWRTVPHKLQGEFKPPISPIRHYLRSLPTLILSLSIQYFSALARHVFTSGGTQNEDGSEPWWSRVIKLLERLYEARKDKQEMVNNKFGDPDKLWLNLELKRIMLDSHLLDKLDESALASAPLTVARSDSSFIIVQKCLKDLEPTRHRALCAFKWASHHLGVVSFENEMCKYSRYSRINPSLLEKVDETFAGRFREILWEALPTDWSKWDVREDRNSLLGMLILLMETNAKFRHDDPDYPKFVKDYIDLLMKIIQAQDDLSLVLTNARRYASGYVPTALFYEGCVRYKYIFKDEGRLFVLAPPLS